MDHLALVGKIWFSRGRFISSVVDRTIMQGPGLENLRTHLKLFSGIVDSCAELRV